MNDRLARRIGAVNYLNTKPLIHRLAERAGQIELVFDLPSRLADRLAADELDVALIPSIEYWLAADYRVVSDACIGCRGPVLSVKLFCRRPVDKITCLALDEGSRTSAALVQILLHGRFGLRPELVSLPIGDGLEDCDADGVLLIGDRAMHSPSGSFHDVWDLGDEWCRWTGLPFVFAMWVARPGVNTDKLESLLAQARDQGVAALTEIAAEQAAHFGLTRPQCLSYLRDNLHFYLGPRERQGLQRFYRRAVELGLVPDRQQPALPKSTRTELDEYDCHTSA
ncbi:MAG: menaquinone biosynthesis protein [Pirellulales bacterium]